MDAYRETSIRIDFEKGLEINPIVVFEGVEMEGKTFTNKTHQIEEVIEFINEWENSGCDVFL